MLDHLQKYGLYTNLKKCWFYQDEVCFLGYVVLSQRIKIEDEQIEAVKNWPETKSVQDIQVFIRFANFYQRFIQGLSKVAALLTSMLKTIESLGSALSVLGAEDEVAGGGGRADEMAKNLSKSKKS